LEKVLCNLSVRYRVLWVKQMDAETVVQTFSDMVYGIAFRYSRNRTDAEDIYSEVFLTYFKKERSFESEEHLKAWLIRVTINAAKAFLGKKPGFAELNEELAAAEEPMQAHEKMDLQAAILQLPETQREAICLFYWQDLTVRQIAEIMGKTEGNVKVILSRARDRLRMILEDD